MATKKIEVVLKSENEKLSDLIKAQDAHVVILNNKLTATQGAMLDIGKKMMEIKAANTMLHHELASLKASGVPTVQGYTSRMVQSHKLHIKIAEPPHYSGKGSLEDWLQQLGIWMQWNEINDDERKITMVLLHLEGGAFTYMSEYTIKAVARQSLSTWEDFVDILKTYPTMVSFTEKFHQWATKTNLGHTALIDYIAEHCDKDVHQAMVTRDSLGITDLTTWLEYLNLCLQLKSKFRADKAGQHGITTSSSQALKPQKDPNVMDMNHASQLTREQKGWLKKKLCVCCEKHLFIFKQHCPDLKYKGKFEMPKRGQATRAVMTPVASTSSDNSKAREEAVHAFLTSYDTKGSEAEPEPTVEAARITEVENDENFLQWVL
ncbi:uncharacterized protein LAESUDRAFT_760037 [Laetiporus sulphureus 93-53]|uniref:Uncharacterized protein n=1 Tax=Laetiporus sulphureus 93-53 TaxID=1314785 RepID=A0A165DX82_9APHY|nr:uncharacterized protein LAESUDRAFT_760037 [Laetiporus sulphureus 93-53]KZT05813.1 hypothetical protein LAESUDRAFT_760037 [Laetiporus sulphureus 93-53]